MPTVAELLRQGREDQKLSVHQLGEITKIRTDHLRALEEGNYEMFSAPVYIKGFVRTCAGVLKLDVKEVMATLDKELARTQHLSEPPPLSTESGGPLDFVMLQLSRVDWRRGLLGAVVVAAVAIGLAVILARRHPGNSDPLADLPPAQFQPTQSVSGATLPLPGSK